MKVVIKKGDKEITTTKTAFDNYFKSNGWKVVGDSATNQPTSEKFEESKVDDNEEGWDEVIDEEVTKPLSEMSRDEMIDFANARGIDIPDGIKTRQIREIIEANI